jgi:hypothetical protein
MCFVTPLHSETEEPEKGQEKVQKKLSNFLAKNFFNSALPPWQ